MKRVLIALALVAAALAGAMSLNAPRVAHAQFIDRIVRPCSAGAVALASVVVNPNSTGNVNVTPCTGGSLTVNGVPVIPGPTTPGGANTQVQFNDSGAFGGDAGLTYNKTTDTLTVGSGGVATNILSTTLSVTVGTSTTIGTFLRLGNPLAATGQLRLANAGSAFTTTIQSGNNVASVVYTWPTNVGAAGSVLTDAAGNGTLSWGVPATGIMGSGTAGTLPYFSAPTVLADSPITRPSATHLQLFGFGPGGADFDSSTPAISLNGSGGLVALGDGGGGNSTTLTINDAGTTITATVNGSGAIDLVAGNNVDFLLNATTNTASLSASSAINVDSKAGVTTIGDVGNVGNSSIVKINDPAGRVEISTGLQVSSTIFPEVAGAAAIGTALLPFSSVIVGSAANSSSQITCPGCSANRVATLPDATGTFLFDTTAGNLPATTGSIGGGLLTAGSCATGTVAVTSSTTSMTVSVSPNTYPGDGNLWYGYVSANGTVTVKVCAIVALTPAASTYNVRVIR